MSERNEKFESAGTPRIGLRLPAGEARFVPGPADSVEIRMTGSADAVERFLVEDRGGEIVIEPESGGGIGRWSGVSIEIRVGSPAAIRARLASGDVVVAMDAESLAIDAAAGEVVAQDITGDVKVKTASGDIRLGAVAGRLDVAAASGDVHVRSVAGDVVAKTASGDIDIGEVSGSVSAHSASGEIAIRRLTGDSFNAKTLSGDVRLGVTSGRKFSVSFQTLSGDVRTDFPVSADSSAATTARLVVKTMSGDVVVRAAD
jgi:DUF4097 and DUF4098 domain-containing protein YvlB